jgi:ABC-type Mn2+/Zn2+ transport system permease subunit/Mn-dependent DtxR family transcriptional regulator/Fe2+ transport system protein FeoA
MELIEILQTQWAMRALLASSMVGIMCGVLGCFIVLRNMSLIGDALSHAILPGVVFGFMIAGYSVLGFFVGSVIAGLLSAVAITWIQQNVKTKNDAAIGIVFTAMFSIGVMGISHLSRTEGVHLDLKDFLFGNVLGVSNEDLYLTGLIGIYVLISIGVFYRYLFATTFQPVIAETMGISVKTVHYFLMLLLSFVVVASLRTVGVILVVAMLITPAATALLLTNRLQRVLVYAGFIGFFSAVSGLILAIIWDTTPGPAMTVVATITYALAMLFSPEKGLVFRYFRNRKMKKKILIEDILKQTLRLSERGSVTVAKLSDKLGFSVVAINRILPKLKRSGLLVINNKVLKLTSDGNVQATRLVRAHRLWETYLVEKMGLTAEQIHEDAERYEHILTDEIMDELEEKLGFPAHDPHGSPIPKSSKLVAFTLVKLGLNQFAKIENQQMNDYIVTRLWELGLLPGSEFKVENISTDFIEINFQNKMIKISMELSKKISVRV